MSIREEELSNVTADTEDIIRKCKVAEIEKMFGQVGIFSIDYILLGKIYDKINRKYPAISLSLSTATGINLFALYAVYFAGYINGKREDRDRRKRVKFC